MRQLVLRAADINDSGYLKKAHSGEWESLQISAKKIDIVHFDVGSIL